MEVHFVLILIRKDVAVTTSQTDARAVREPVEWVALGVALALSVGVTSILMSTTKSSLLLYDGDSQLPLLWRASIWAAQPQAWVLSSPLFVIEIVLYGPAALLPLPNATSMALFSIISWFAFYLSARALTAAAGLRAAGGAISALAIVAVLAFEASLEQSPDRNSLEPASLLSTTTYYSGSIIATLVLPALVTRMVRSSHELKPLFMAAAVSVSTVASMSNPLFVAWTIAPLALVLLVLGVAGINRTVALISLATIVCGAVVGMLARIPYSSILVQDNLAKVRPDWASQSLQYYGGLLGRRLSEPGGLLEAVVVLLGFTFAAVVLVISVQRRHAAAVAVAGFAVVSPILVALASIIAGTFATRYLQPIAFFPPLAACAAFAILRPRQRFPTIVRNRSRTRAVTAAALIAVVVAASSSTAALAKTITTPDPSMTCAVQWINQRGVPGAGQYWSVRAVKAAISDPRNLIQTDENLRGYSWLINANDFRIKQVYFTIADAQSPPFQLNRRPTSVIRCGQYTIDDYGSVPLNLEAAHH